MKIVLIQPSYKNFWESLSHGCLIAWLKRYGPVGLEFEFFQTFFDPAELIIDRAASADLAAFSVTSPTYREALGLAELIKRKNSRVRTVFGGVHPSALPDKVARHAAVDQVVVGEGELALQSIVAGETSTIVTGQAVTTLVPADREAIKNHREIDRCEQMCGLRIASFQFNRGCPFDCSICGEKTVTAHRVRQKEPELLWEEITAAQRRYGINYFKFTDATWNINTEQCRNFCEVKIRSGNPLPFECNLHAGNADGGFLRLLRRAGCEQVNVGCESGSPRILRALRKRVTPERLRELFAAAADAGLRRRAFFVVGVPGETRADIALTEELAEQLRPDVFGVTMLCPYPGSDYYDEERYGDIDFSDADEYSNSFYRTEHFTNRELRAIQQRLMMKFKHVLAPRAEELFARYGAGEEGKTDER